MLSEVHEIFQSLARLINDFGPFVFGLVAFLLIIVLLIILLIYLAKAMFSLEEDEQLYGFRRGDEKR